MMDYIALFDVYEHKVRRKEEMSDSSDIDRYIGYATLGEVIMIGYEEDIDALPNKDFEPKPPTP